MGASEMDASLLTSFVFLRSFQNKRADVPMRSWALDSGAFTAHNSGKAIDLREYIRTAKELQSQDTLLWDVFALDVIGDAKASLNNANKMRQAGVEAIPTFHFGSDLNDLKHIAKDFPKIALGGLAAKRAGNHGQQVSKSEKYVFLQRCFEVIWPTRIHLFGCTDEKLLLTFPAESADSTSWHLQPSRYGLWKNMGRLRGVRGKALQSGIRGQIRYCLDVEKQVQGKWRHLHLSNSIKEFSYRFATTGAELKYFKKVQT